MRFEKIGLIFKFGLSLSLLIIATASLLTLFLIFSERVRITSDLKDKGYILSRNIAYGSERAIVNNDANYLQIMLNGLKNEKDIVYAQIVNTKGTILAQISGLQTVRSSVFNIDVPIESIIAPKLSKKIPIGPWSKTSDLKLVGEVKLGISLSKVDDAMAQISQIIFGITLGVVIFGVLGVFVLTRLFLVSPLEKFVVGTKKIAGGDLDYKIRIESVDEIGDLAQSFNQMTSNLKVSNKKIEMHAKTLEDKVKERTSELEAALEEVKAANQKKTEFLSVMSHELKTPLTPIQEFTLILLEKILGPLNEKQEDALKTIKRQSKHLNNLIDGILDVARLETGKTFAIKKEFVYLPEIIKEIEEAFSFDLQKLKLALELDLPADVPTIYADRSALSRLMLNLVGNSMKFTPKGGKISIRVKGGKESINACVIDSGIGIAAENISRIFEKFYQVDSSYTREAGGLGMGLAIAKGIVEAHHGTIFVESKGLGYGTKVCFNIPVAQE
ncbi:HAMP domain-containing histidine kinase [Candidatus Saganbacteria bacterium]|nr:HAMP domain-containing histidine kinase [Candidatus Saganbacteria bacterium]